MEINQIFGRLTVIDSFRKNKSGKTRSYCKCLCDCGTVIIVRSDSLKNGHTKSCGCLHRDINRKRLTTHGESKNPTFITWRQMIQRCCNPKSKSYPHYGERGVAVCEQWVDSYQTFLSDMGERPKDKTLDRIDNDGNYEPSNCRWATLSEQVCNRTNTIRFTINSETKTLMEWCKTIGRDHMLVRGRLARGKTPYQALFTPIQKKH